MFRGISRSRKWFEASGAFNIPVAINARVYLVCQRARTWTSSGNSNKTGGERKKTRTGTGRNKRAKKVRKNRGERRERRSTEMESSQQIGESRVFSIACPFPFARKHRRAPVSSLFNFPPILSSFSSFFFLFFSFRRFLPRLYFSFRFKTRGLVRFVAYSEKISGLV